MAETPSKSSAFKFLVLVLLVPIAVSLCIYHLDEFEAVDIPEIGWSWYSVSVPKHYSHVLNVTETIGVGFLPGPEDLVYDEEARVIYTGCSDGWIKRIKLTESGSETTVENWIYVGGRPLGLAFGPHKELVIAETHKGLMKVTREGVVEWLIDEAEGIKFGLINGVDVAQNGVIYFTDASYKYNISTYMLNTLEGRPYGRLVSFDPSTNKTQVLVPDLYFANGVAVSPQQDFVVFCETMLRRCRRYYVQGEKKGATYDFVDNLPGFPDNIRYDGEDKFWIAITSGKTIFWHLISRYPSLRKATTILTRYVNLPHVTRDGGALAVNLDGELIALYSDHDMSMISSAIKVKDHLYFGSLAAPYIRRVDLKRLFSDNVA